MEHERVVATGRLANARRRRREEKKETDGIISIRESCQPQLRPDGCVQQKKEEQALRN